MPAEHQHRHDPTFYRSPADANAAPAEKLERFFPQEDAFRGRRAHQVRLQGGEASSDSYCFPS